MLSNEAFKASGGGIPPVEDDPTAQAVIDAMRFVLMAQDDPGEVKRLVKFLLEWAPDTMSDDGIELIRRCVGEGSLKLAVVDA